VGEEVEQGARESLEHDDGRPDFAVRGYIDHELAPYRLHRVEVFIR
jgi:hypothetical protein